MRGSVFRGCRAVRFAALLVLVGGPLVGCGIQETAVVEAGEPAVADLLPPREERVLLFFRSPDGALRPVPRIVASPWPDAPRERDGADGSSPAAGGASSPLAAVTALLAGPDRTERRAGFRNAPSLSGAASAVGRVVADGSTVEVELRLRVTRLTASAREQIVCTAAYAAHARGAVSVALAGRGDRLAPAHCPVRPVPVPAR